MHEITKADAPISFLQEELPVRLLKQLSLLHSQPFASLNAMQALSSNLISTVSTILSLPEDSKSSEAMMGMNYPSLTIRNNSADSGGQARRNQSFNTRL
jgi:hypothetical protein